MLSIIDDILDISNIEAGRVELDPADFDLRETIEQAVAPARLEARGKRARVRPAPDRDIPRRSTATARECGRSS